MKTGKDYMYRLTNDDNDFRGYRTAEAVIDEAMADARRAALNACIKAIDDHRCGGCPEHSRAFWVDELRALLDDAGAGTCSHRAWSKSRPPICIDCGAEVKP